MQLTTILATLTTLLAASVEACKCGGNIDATRACCRSTGGVPSGDDCPANQISERLSNFAACCRNLGARSDCRCPVGCVLAQENPVRLAKGLKPLTEAEAKEIAESYL